jgi:hypothetical protein
MSLSILNFFEFSNLFSEVFFMQIAILLNIILLLFIRNTFYTLLYFFIFTFQIGLFISFFQMELFTGFLYVLEITAVFIMLIVMFYLNFKGNSTFNKNYNFVICIYVLLTVLLFPTFYTECELYLPNLFNCIDIWDNYYESINNYYLNDFIGLYLSYFLINSFELIIMGFILFLGSILCIVIFNLAGFTKNNNYILFKNFINFYFKLLDFYFLRKQNLIKQNMYQPGLRIIKNKLD